MTPSAGSYSGSRPWRALTLLFLVGVLNLFDRQIINILAEDIKSELVISDAKLGLLTGTAFGIFYSVMGIPLGRLADRVDRVRLMAAALALWSGFTMICGAASSFAMLFLARMGVGVGEASAQPSSTAMIPDLFPPNQRATAMSVLLLSAPTGSFFGLLVGGLAAAHWGWRMTFLVAGLPGLLLALVLVFTLRDPGPASRSGATERVLPAIWRLLGNPRFRWLGLGLSAATFLVYATGAWLPPFLIRVHHLSTAQVGLYAAIAIGLGGGVGTLAGGLLCDWLRERYDSIEFLVLVGALLASVPTLLVTLFATSLVMTIVAMFLLNVALYAFLSPNVRLIQVEAGDERRALGTALCMSLSNVVNLGIGLPLIGLLSDKLSGDYGHEAIRYALAIGGVLAASLGVLAYLRARSARQRDLVTADSIWG